MKADVEKGKQIANEYFTDGIYSENIQLSDVKGVSYNFNKVAPNLYMASNSVSSGTFYNFFTLDEVRTLKRELIGSSNMFLLLTKTLGNAEKAIDLTKTAEEFFSRYKKDGLIYSVLPQGRKVQITLDMSDDKLLSNLVWAITSSLYKFKD